MQWMTKAIYGRLAAPGPSPTAPGAAAHRLRRAGMVASAVIGAICGGVFAYRDVHHATKFQLARLGKAVPANSSALLTFADAPDPQAAIDAAVREDAQAASVAVVGEDLSALV